MPYDTQATIEAITDFWFEHTKPEDWFRGGQTFDDTLREKWSDHYEAALDGQLKEAFESPKGCIALCLLWDQYPRNVFRGTPRAFATDSLALSVSRCAVEAGFDKNLSNPEKLFLYLPFEHSEHLGEQARAVALFSDHEPMTRDFAIKHVCVIERFGRFPGRNQAIGRPSSAAEIAFLDSDEGKAF